VIHVGMLGQIQLSMLLQGIETYQKTGRLIITQNNIREEIYIYQGQVVAVVSAYTHQPLVRRLVRSGIVSLNDLQKVPANIGQVISQPQGTEQYSDVKIAKVLIKLGLIHQEQLKAWVRQETTEALRQLLTYSTGEIHFEENVQPPADCLSVLSSTVVAAADQYVENSPSEWIASPAPSDKLFKSLPPVTLAEQPTVQISQPLRFKQSTTSAELIIPVTASGFARLPKAVFTTQTMIQRTAAVIRPLAQPNYVITAKVAIPPRPNPLFSWETLLIVVILLIAGLAHGINMFHFPFYYEDEGTYMAQAWAVIHQGKLAPYTYMYDHAPAGWLQIALWTIVSGGFHTFGMVVNSGRVFMLLIQICATFLLYLIARNISRSTMIAVIVSLLFALSPYGLYYHRRVILDNISTIWMLLSILLLVTKRIRLRNVQFSAIAFSLSILSKETTIFLLPAMVYLVYYQVEDNHRWFAVISWIAFLFTIVSFYPLGALLKNELFPTGTLLGGTR
jgi:hypothetical protein